jgi:four helix bundle protein
LSVIKSFEELPMWKDARKFTNKIYNLTKKFPSKEVYGLNSQITRSAVSIMSNIAEGFDRFSSREFIRFLVIARGSISEVQNDLYIALDLKYISKNEFQSAYDDAKNIGKQINGFIKYLRNHKDVDLKISEIIGTYEND